MMNNLKRKLKDFFGKNAAIWTAEFKAKGILKFNPHIESEEDFLALLLKLEQILNSMGAIEVDGTKVYARFHFSGEEITYMTEMDRKEVSHGN